MSNANCLAFSKFRSLPNNNSASNSLVIDDSKSSKLPAIPSISLNWNPKDFAVATALANSAVLIPKETVVALDTSLISFITSASFKATLNLFAVNLACPKSSFVCNSKSPPVASAIDFIPDSSS